MNPFFSICIPNFNYAHYLAETVESVLEQDFKDFEVIIVDNHSIDASWQLIQNFNDPRIRKFQNRSNIGFAPNLQAAVSKANGKFVHLLSADDKMKPGVLKKYHDAISLQTDWSKLFLLSDVSYIDGNSNEYAIEERDPALFQSRKIQFERYEGKGEIISYAGTEILQKVLPNLKNPAPFLSVMASKELLDRVEGFNAIRTIGPDKFLNYKLLFQNPIVLYIRIIGFQYRIHQSANMVAQATNLNQQIDDYLNILDFANQAKEIGVEQKKMINSFLTRVCYKSGLNSIVNNNATQAWRLIGAMLFFPREAFRNYRFYVLFLLLVIYPISRLLLKSAKFIVKYKFIN